MNHDRRGLCAKLCQRMTTKQEFSRNWLQGQTPAGILDTPSSAAFRGALDCVDVSFQYTCPKE